MEPSEAGQFEDLLDQARRGQPAERDRLFAACRDRLLLAARGELQSRLQAKVDPSDLVQQTLLEAHRDFARFQGETAAQWWSWLRSILDRNAADVARAYLGTAKRQAGREVAFRPAGSDSLAPGAAPEPAADDATPSQQVMLDDRQRRLALAIEQLPADYRQVIELRNLQRLPFDEVAERMGRSRPAVQMLWARALKKLQSQLGDISWGT